MSDFEERKVDEELEWKRINGHPDHTREDARMDLQQRCGRLWNGDGRCTKAGSTYCDWECPY